MISWSPLMTGVSWLYFTHNDGGDIGHDKSLELLKIYKLNSIIKRVLEGGWIGLIEDLQKIKRLNKN